MKKNYKILIIDDETVITDQLNDVFAEEYEVVIANSGEAGLAVFKGTDIDLVICDQMMPGIKGVDVLIEMAKASRLTRRILLTGNADLGFVKTAINEGSIHRFEEKPLDMARLRTIVSNELVQYAKECETLDRSKITEKAIWAKMGADQKAKSALNTLSNLVGKFGSQGTQGAAPSSPQLINQSQMKPAEQITHVGQSEAISTAISASQPKSVMHNHASAAKNPMGSSAARQVNETSTSSKSSKGILTEAQREELRAKAGQYISGNLGELLSETNRAAQMLIHLIFRPTRLFAFLAIGGMLAVIQTINIFMAMDYFKHHDYLNLSINGINIFLGVTIVLDLSIPLLGLMDKSSSRWTRVLAGVIATFMLITISARGVITELDKLNKNNATARQAVHLQALVNSDSKIEQEQIIAIQDIDEELTDIRAEKAATLADYPKEYLTKKKTVIDSFDGKIASVQARKEAKEQALASLQTVMRGHKLELVNLNPSLKKQTWLSMENMAIMIPLVIMVVVRIILMLLSYVFGVVLARQWRAEMIFADREKMESKK